MVSISVSLDWDPTSPHILEFSFIPTADDVIKLCEEKKYIDKTIYHYPCVNGYLSNEKITEKNILITNDPAGNILRHSILNWIFPILFWSSLSIPYILYKYNYSIEIIAISIVAITGSLAIAAYTYSPEALFYPKRDTMELSSFEIFYILFFVTLSPTFGFDDIIEFSDSSSSDDDL